MYYYAFASSYSGPSAYEKYSEENFPNSKHLEVSGFPRQSPIPAIPTSRQKHTISLTYTYTHARLNRYPRTRCGGSMLPAPAYSIVIFVMNLDSFQPLESRLCCIRVLFLSGSGDCRNWGSPRKSSYLEVTFFFLVSFFRNKHIVSRRPARKASHGHGHGHVSWRKW